MEFSSRGEVILWILSHQLARRNLTDIQMIEVALKYKDIISSAMKEKQLEASSRGGKSYSPIDGKKDMVISPEPSQNANEDEVREIKPTTARKELAKIAGVSEWAFRNGKLILEKGTPEQIERAREGGKGTVAGLLPDTA